MNAKTFALKTNKSGIELNRSCLGEWGRSINFGSPKSVTLGEKHHHDIR